MAGTGKEREIFTPEDFTRLGIISPLIGNVSPDDSDREILKQYEQACVVDNLRFLIKDDSRAREEEPDEVWRGIEEVLKKFGNRKVKIGCIFTNTAGDRRRRDILPFEGEFTSSLGIAREIEKPIYLKAVPILIDEETRLLIYVLSEGFSS